MDVRQLSAIVAIADHGTFSAAARSLFTVQSNVSGHISRLEKELGVVLVDRAQGGLTEDGSRVVERARRVLNEIEDITSDMTSRHDKVSGHTRIGVIGTTARWLTPSLLRQLALDHPNVRAVIREGASSSLVPNVMSGELNAAVIHLPIDEPELVVEPLFAEDLFLLVDDQHRLAGADTVAIAELDDEPLLLPPTGSALRKRARSLGRSQRRDAAAPGRDRRRPAAGVAWPSTDSARRSCRRPPCPTWLTGAFRRINVPELPRRVVAVDPSTPTDAQRARRTSHSTR